MEIEIREILYNSVEQADSVALRYRVLREPLELNFKKEDLEMEYLDFHIAAFVQNKLTGILLLKPFGDTQTVKMRQVAVDTDEQGKGIGKALVKYSENFIKEKGFVKIELHARETAVPFYLALGYKVEGDIFLEVNIPHKKMFLLL